jgi:hypothetical protein
MLWLDAGAALFQTLASGTLSFPFNDHKLLLPRMKQWLGVLLLPDFRSMLSLMSR